jgi:hypothetical protein
MKCEDLPDYAAFQQVERALWKQGKTRGAAIFVGAGFSRNAQLIHDGATPPPLWSDLAKAMEERLYPGAHKWRDPLRLAEEFRAVLGEPALEGLIRELVPDDEWVPGALHKKLVGLPWVDILTTNWDTLIERAAKITLGQTYETVRCLEDIATTRAPRVVKLHGSLPSNRPFILSEEDYRTYPQRFAPFVNLVQQVLLENELCLLGFSGDDPNFLKWTGWIRDQLGASARRIYVVGKLNLSSAQRRLLELRNISAIDLAPLVHDVDPTLRHQKAAEIFLDHLAAARPPADWEWPPSDKEARSIPKDPAVMDAALVSLVRRWSQQRKTFPGWAICPQDVRGRLNRSVTAILPNIRDALARLPAIDRGRIVFECLWRLDAALWPVPQWIVEDIQRVAESIDCWEDQSQRMFVIISLLRTARENGDEAAFAKWKLTIETLFTRDPDATLALLYERCLRARDRLDFDELGKLNVTLDGTDSLWKLRRATLLCDLGEFRDARALVETALAETREQFYRNRESIWVLSRLAWAQLSARQYRLSWDEVLKEQAPDESDSLRARLHETKCDPWDVIHAMERETDEEIRRLKDRPQVIETLFDAGTYRDHGRTVTFGGQQESAVYAWGRLADQVGLPLRIKNVIVLISRMENAETLGSIESKADYLRVLRMVQAGAERLLERAFGRIQIALLSEELLSFLGETVTRALTYAVGQMSKRKEGLLGGCWSQRTAVYAEILSRLVLRAKPQAALDLLQRGLAFGKEPSWNSRDLFEPLDHLIQRALSAIPPADKAQLLTDAICFPLPDERGISGHFARDWPLAAAWIPEDQMVRPADDRRFAERVAVLIEKTRFSEAQTRGRAALWLTELYREGALTVQESGHFGEALWSRREPDNGFPCDTLLRSFVFVSVPGPDKQAAIELLKESRRHSSSSEYFVSLAGATRGESNGRLLALFTAAESIQKLKNILAWKPAEVPPFDLGQMANENRKCQQAIGAVVADALLPVLNREDLSPSCINEIFEFESTAFSIVQAFPELLRFVPQSEERAITGILKAMVSREADQTSAGFNAIYRWMRLHREGGLHQIPKRLLDSVVSIVETRREPGLLHALNLSSHLLYAGALDRDAQERIIAVLGLIFIEASYGSARDNPTLNLTTITLVRAAAVQLAVALRSKGNTSAKIQKWIEDAAEDPMPEVRFATTTPPE